LPVTRTNFAEDEALR